MGTEIERKFLVASDAWREGAVGTRMRQGYFSRNPTHTARVRVAGNEAFITIKSKRRGLSRAEFEYPIPPADAEELINLCSRPLIEKTRYVVPHEGHEWEVDVFEGANAGLILAELELDREDEIFAPAPLDRPGGDQ